MILDSSQMMTRMYWHAWGPPGEQFLHRHGITHVVHHGGDVVQPIGKRHHLLVGERLRGLSSRDGGSRSRATPPAESLPESWPAPGACRASWGGRPEIDDRPLLLFRERLHGGRADYGLGRLRHPSRSRKAGQLLALLDRVILPERMAHELFVIRIRRKKGCPSNRMPYWSKASRSNQSAPSRCR